MKIHDDTYFGEKPEGGGILYGEVRKVADEQRKLELLKRRIDTLLISQISPLADFDNNRPKIWSPFPLMILTCLAIETLGRIIIETKTLKHDEESKTISKSIYILMDKTLANKPSKIFMEAQTKLRGKKDDKINSFADVIYKYMRNTYYHGYQGKGVYLEHSINKMWIEGAGVLIINPYLFWSSFKQLYELSFVGIISNTNKLYRMNAINYFTNLIL